MQASPAPAAKRSAAPPGAARQVQKPLSHARFARKKSRRQALTFSFYKARPLRRQKYSSLRMAENSCRLQPLRRQNAPPPPTRRGSTGAKAVFASPLRRQKYSSLRMAENSCRLNPLRRKNAPPPPTRRGSTGSKAAFASPLHTKKVKAESALTFSFL